MPGNTTSMADAPVLSTSALYRRVIAVAVLVTLDTLTHVDPVTRTSGARSRPRFDMSTVFARL